MIHNEYTQENPRKNRKETQDHVQWICLPQGEQHTARGSSWGLPSLSLTTKGSWMHLGGRSPSLSPISDASTLESTKRGPYSTRNIGRKLISLPMAVILKVEINTANVCPARPVWHQT